MKAAVFHGPHQPLTIEDVDIDKPIGREVLVRVVASGVCHSDLHFVDGYYPFPTPAILGHEAAGLRFRSPGRALDRHDQPRVLPVLHDASPAAHLAEERRARDRGARQVDPRLSIRSAAARREKPADQQHEPERVEAEPKSSLFACPHPPTLPASPRARFLPQAAHVPNSRRLWYWSVKPFRNAASRW